MLPMAKERALPVELGPDTIRVAGVAPAFTEMPPAEPVIWDHGFKRGAA